MAWTDALNPHARPEYAQEGRPVGVPGVFNVPERCGAVVHAPACVREERAPECAYGRK